MAMKPQPMPLAEWKACRKQEKLRAHAHAAAMAAGEIAIARGDTREEVARAMREARERIMPTGGALAPVPVRATPPGIAATLPGEGWTKEKQRAFLVHLAGTGCVSQACAHVGMSRQSAYKLRNRASHSVFAVAWDVAIHLAQQLMLDEATERALQGAQVPIWYHGEQVGTRIVHNDRLLMFLLRRKREPIHSVLDAHEMTALFPSMLEMVDQLLPSPLTAERVRELKEDHGFPLVGDEPEEGELDFGDDDDDDYGDEEDEGDDVGDEDASEESFQ